MTPELIKWLAIMLSVVAVAAIVGPEALRCWKMHIHYKARKQQMDFEHDIILKILKHQSGKGDE